MSELLDKVISAAEEAGRIMLSETDFTVEKKTTKENYVTSSDRMVEDMLRTRLREILPGSGVMGEERGTTSGSSEYLWVVDPIDGTANYARGFNASVCSIGLVRGGEAVLGVVRNPYTGETFWAEKGQGAFVNGRRIRVSDRDSEHQIITTGWSQYDKSISEPLFEISHRLFMHGEDLRRTGTAAYDLCLIAKGASEMHFEIRLCPWDFAAGSVILREAGGFSSSLDGPLILEGPQCPVLAANSKENLEYLRRTVVDVLGDRRFPRSRRGRTAGSPFPRPRG